MKTRWKVLLAGTGGAIIAVATAFQWSRYNYEEPAYEEIAAHGPLQVRRYPARIVAQTVVEGGEGDVTSEGFRRLAGYIFGGNAGEQSISMTTPVEASPEGTRIDMTTPVERSPSEGGFVIAFTMPSEHTLETLPAPDDPRVTLQARPPQTVAVLRFSGRVDVEERQARTDELLRLMREHDLHPVGEPTLAQYDPPWVLGPFRRNEIHVPVGSQS